MTLFAKLFGTKEERLLRQYLKENANCTNAISGQQLLDEFDNYKVVHSDIAFKQWEELGTVDRQIHFVAKNYCLLAWKSKSAIEQTTKEQK